MYIFNYLPSILLAMFLTLNFSFMVRMLIEGASLKTALLSLSRFYFMPLALLILVNGMHDHKRKIIFQMKQDKDTYELSDKVEHLLESKFNTRLYIIKFISRFYRLGIDTFITSSIQFEKQKATKIKRKKNQKSFYEFYLDDSNVEVNLFNKGII